MAIEKGAFNESAAYLKNCRDSAAAVAAPSANVKNLLNWYDWALDLSQWCCNTGSIILSGGVTLVALFSMVLLAWQPHSQCCCDPGNIVLNGAITCSSPSMMVLLLLPINEHMTQNRLLQVLNKYWSLHWSVQQKEPG